MSEWKKYERTGISEMKAATQEDFADYNNNISVSKEDSKEVNNLISGRSIVRGMIARNPDNHDDQWYVARKYFEENFESAQQEKEE